jgi:hypothetical protein
LPGCAVANVGSFAFLVGNPTRKRIETATAHTGERWLYCKNDHIFNKMLNKKISLILTLSLLTIQISGQHYCRDTINSNGVKICAKFKGDETGKKFARFIEKSLKYPKVSKNEVLSGCVIARFLVDIHGNLFNIQIIHSLREDYDNAVIEAMKRSPKWTPATFNSKPIGTVHCFPVYFGKNKKEKGDDCKNALKPTAGHTQLFARNL